MAIGKQSDFKVYQEYFQSGFIEEQQKNVNVFNAASAGAIALRTEALKGDYNYDAFFKYTSGISRRDVTSTSAATAIVISQDENIGVKINRKYGPFDQTVNSFLKIGKSPEEMAMVLGRQMASELLSDQVDSAVRAAVAGIAGVTTGGPQSNGLTYDATSLGSGVTDRTLRHEFLVEAMSRFGDQANRIACWVMHSKPFFNLMGRVVTEKIFDVTSLLLFQGDVATFGKPVIIVDSPALITATGGSNSVDQYSVLGLTAGAVEVVESEPPVLFIEDKTGGEQLYRTYQSEIAYNLNLKGFKWDVANGGANPTNSAVATSTNWDKVATDNKSLAGVRVLCR